MEGEGDDDDDDDGEEEEGMMRSMRRKRRRRTCRLWLFMSRPHASSLPSTLPLLLLITSLFLANN